MKLLRWLRVSLKTILARHWLLIEFCHDCGREQPVVWSASDALWLQVMGAPNGVCCPDCFDRRAVALGLHLRWHPHVEGDEF